MHVIRRTRNSCGAGDAAQTENWNALDVWRKPHAIHETRVDRRGGNSRHRGDKNRAQLIGLDSCACERATERLLAQIQRALDPHIIRLAKRLQIQVEIDRADSVPSLDLHALIEAIQNRGVWQPISPVVLERFHQQLLLVVMLWKRTCNASNSHSSGS